MSLVVETKTRELKPEQELAAHTIDRHVSVTAGPGAGKTTVLVERYLHILRTHDISVDQIVAITFTNRAANEMRERLRRELDNLLSSSTPRDRAKWMRHKRTLDGAIITTIHGFCSRLLREFPVEADIDPQFTLLDAHQSSMLEETVAEDVLAEFISLNDRSVAELAAGVGRVSLARGFIDIYRAMRNQGLTVAMLEEQIAGNHKTIEDYKLVVEQLILKMSAFIQSRDLSPTAEEKRAQAARRWPQLRDFLVAVTDDTTPADFSEAVQAFREATKPKAVGKGKELINELNELIWKDRLGGRVPQTFFDLHAKRYALDLIKVVHAIEKKLDEEKRRKSALDFDDLQLRALKLLRDHPAVLRRASSRYRFFLVDEFQDTNGLQRDLLATLALGGADTSDWRETENEKRRVNQVQRANLFIVGDRKQSIYGFRGADVDVFREMTERIEAQNGLPVSLNRNFRSQPPLIRFFNLLFENVFEIDPATASVERNQLGYVEHESSIAAREDQDSHPVVEILVDLKLPDKGSNASRQPKPRERDAEQLATRIISMVGIETISSPALLEGETGSRRTVAYRDVALLFRAMTEVHIYESAFRRRGIPYVTVDGKGFYAREEITDFVQLLRFLDNKTDEVALAAVLRSPLCGLSDDVLLALRCAPLKVQLEGGGLLHRRSGIRPLLAAVGRHEEIDFIEEADRPSVDRARALLEELIRRAKRSGLADLLRFAVEVSEYRTVAAASFAGAQRLANIEKLFTLAERFERSGAYMIRDFVRYVREFEEAGGRESEGQIDDSADAVRLMSIHQSKGLEFPVVVIPDLHRLSDNRREWWALDRHRGLTTKAPNGRGRLAAGSTFTDFGDRAKRREEYETMRLLYVAATRAKDRVVLSGAVRAVAPSKSSWFGWICKALAISKDTESGLLRPGNEVEVRFTLTLPEVLDQLPRGHENTAVESEQNLRPPENENFPLLAPIGPERGSGLHRFSVTQLLNYDRCPRQYYFDRLLHTPAEEEVAVWNDAEAPEPPANLTATLRGAVIHRFCEKFTEGDDLHESLRSSFEVVLRQRAAELGDRVMEIDSEKAVHDLLPLARNYLESKVRQRIEETRAVASSAINTSAIRPGVSSEQRFRLRRPLGILTGTIDKLLIQSSDSGVSVEIIDFKTNRFRGRERAGRKDLEPASGHREGRRGSKQARSADGQLALAFVEHESSASNRDLLMQSEVEAVAADYKIQMQAYALAVRELIPAVASVRVTLHFLDPDIEISLAAELLDSEACRKAIDEAMLNIVSSPLPGSFPANPAGHCRTCNFRELCPPGLEWLSKQAL